MESTKTPTLPNGRARALTPEQTAQAREIGLLKDAEASSRARSHQLQREIEWLTKALEVRKRGALGTQKPPGLAQNRPSIDLRTEEIEIASKRSRHGAGTQEVAAGIGSAKGPRSGAQTEARRTSERVEAGLDGLDPRAAHNQKSLGSEGDSPPDVVGGETREEELVALKAQLAAELAHASELGAELVIANAPRPTPRRDRSILFGHLTSQDDSPLPNKRIVAVSTQLSEPVAEASTDDEGYFLLEIVGHRRPPRARDGKPVPQLRIRFDGPEVRLELGETDQSVSLVEETVHPFQSGAAIYVTLVAESVKKSGAPPESGACRAQTT